jgi:hypothetical protein
MKPALAFRITFFDRGPPARSGRLPGIQRFSRLSLGNAACSSGPLAADRFVSRTSPASGPLRKSGRGTAGSRRTARSYLAGSSCGAHSLRSAGTILIRARLAWTRRESLSRRRRACRTSHTGRTRGTCRRWALRRRNSWSRSRRCRRSSGPRCRRMCGGQMRCARRRCRRSRCRSRRNATRRNGCGRCCWSGGSAQGRSRGRRCCAQSRRRWAGRFRRRCSRSRYGPRGFRFRRRNLGRFRGNFRRCQTEEVFPRQLGVLDINRARVRLLFLDADLRQVVNQHLGLDLEFPRQLVQPDLFGI